MFAGKVSGICLISISHVNHARERNSGSVRSSAHIGHIISGYGARCRQASSGIVGGECSFICIVFR